MSILIKGMNVPTKCADCPLINFTDFDSMPFCNITGEDICFRDWQEKRGDICPLIPVPPHGDLIDMNAVEWFRITGMVKVGETDCGEKTYIVLPISHIDELPVIIPAEGEQK